MSERVSLILSDVVSLLVERELLVLRPGECPDVLAQELAHAIGQAPQFAQLGTTVGRLLIASPRVDELYADTEQIIEAVNDVGMARR